MSRFARKVDDNHAAIRDGLRACGVRVHDTSRLGGGFPDLLCRYFGRIVLLEVKDPRQVPSKRRLTAAEAEFHAEWKDWVATVETLDEALGAVGAKRRERVACDDVACGHWRCGGGG